MPLTLHLLNSCLDRLLNLLPEEPSHAKRLDDIVDPDSAEPGFADAAGADEAGADAAWADEAGVEPEPARLGRPDPGGMRVVEGAPSEIRLRSSGESSRSLRTGTR
jgi:hypothetical protein